ncbi:hypothetical protein NE237_017145 [Protea cynaroides]|uniref:Uncharacterized protein n=1 Tax=Protea cynaroides TaxID=273540 RepID=A0A9Q0K7I7_9MAGN|nr:hypothetical protein NE237_017145 [Protea cynaroides]
MKWDWTIEILVCLYLRLPIFGFHDHSITSPTRIAIHRGLKNITSAKKTSPIVALNPPFGPATRILLLFRAIATRRSSSKDGEGITGKGRRLGVVMAVASLSICTSSLTHRPKDQNPRSQKPSSGVKGVIPSPSIISETCNIHGDHYMRRLSSKFTASAGPEGSAKSSKSEETIPSWAKPDSDEQPPWAKDEGKQNLSGQTFEIPFYAYLLASAVVAIAAVGSIFEYVNQKPVFGILNSDSIFYAPLLGFFAFTGVPTSAFLWFKSVQAANKAAKEQDQKDGFL